MRMQFKKKSALEIKIWGFSAYRFHKTELDHHPGLCVGEKRRGVGLVSPTLRGWEQRRND